MGLPTSPILHYPHPILNKKCDICTSGAEHILAELNAALRDPQGNLIGVGLSANQIGIDKRVCIVRFGEHHLNLVNPIILKHSDNRRGSVEQCLSLPNCERTIMRWEQIVVKCDSYTKPLIVENWDVSRIIQHELDHLDGRTLLDHGKVGRNDPCLCGSGKKYKKCCENK